VGIFIGRRRGIFLFLVWIEGGHDEGGVEDGTGLNGEAQFLALEFYFLKEGVNELLLDEEVTELYDGGFVGSGFFWGKTDEVFEGEAVVDLVFGGGIGEFEPALKKEDFEHEKWWVSGSSVLRGVEVREEMFDRLPVDEFIDGGEEFIGFCFGHSLIG